MSYCGIKNTENIIQLVENATAKEMNELMKSWRSSLVNGTLGEKYCFSSVDLLYTSYLNQFGGNLMKEGTAVADSAKLREFLVLIDDMLTSGRLSRLAGAEYRYMTETLAKSAMNVYREITGQLEKLLGKEI